MAIDALFSRNRNNVLSANSETLENLTIEKGDDVVGERHVPPEIQSIFEQARNVEIKPVESAAERSFEKHGLEFHKQAIRSVMRSSGCGYKCPKKRKERT